MQDKLQTTLGDILTPAVLTAIQPGAEAPLFNADGSPRLDAEGQSLTLSYTHAAAAMFRLLLKAGIMRPGDESGVRRQVASLTTAELAKTNAETRAQFMYWQPTDVLVASGDGKLLLTQRSHYTQNAIGLALNTAAGFPKVVDGVPETPEGCGARELKEETGLDWPTAETGRVWALPAITKRPLQYFPLKATSRHGNAITMHGVVPTTVRESAAELTQRMRLNAESVGVLVMDFKNFDELLSSNKPKHSAMFTYLRSSAPAYAELTSVNGRLDDIREALQKQPALTPEQREAEPAALMQWRYVFGGQADFMHNGSKETLAKSLAALSIIHNAPMPPDMYRVMEPFFPAGSTARTVQLTPG